MPGEWTKVSGHDADDRCRGFRLSVTIFAEGRKDRRRID